MATQIVIALDGDMSTGSPRFAPGTLLKGRVDVLSDKDVNCRSVELWVEWRTQGRGDRNSEKLPAQTLYSGAIIGGTPLYENFTFQLPNEPWSYSGHYVSIIWEVKVKLNVAFGGDAEASQAFVMRPIIGGTPKPQDGFSKEGWFGGSFDKPVEEKYDPFAKEEHPEVDVFSKETDFDPFAKDDNEDTFGWDPFSDQKK